MFARMLPVFVLVTSVGFAGAQDKKRPDEVSAKAKGLVEKQLIDLKAHSPKVRVIEEKYVREIFPNHTFVAVHFGIWPIATPTPEPLKSQNLYAVSKEGKLTHLPDSTKLEEFFRMSLGEKLGRGLVARTWMRLRIEYFQDGYYKFKPPSETWEPLQSQVPIRHYANGAVEVVPEIGNKGQVDFTVVFDESNRFLRASEDNKIVRGRRPGAKRGER